MGRSAPGQTQGRAAARRLALCPLAAALAAALPGAPAAEPAAGTECRLVPFATARVEVVVDGRSFLLDDGREVRLAGIEVPSLGPQAAEEPAAAAARAALQRLIGENEVVLKHLAPAADRYGRLVAHAFVRTAAGETSLARALVAQGHALSAARRGEAGCGRDLLAAERTARAAKLGLWGDPRYDVKRAENPAEVLAGRGRYALVEGKVLSVRESGSTIYLNFGRRWTRDFTVTIARRNQRAFAEAGLAPHRLQGRRIQVRGVIEERGGPWIDAVRPEQIEVIGN